MSARKLWLWKAGDHFLAFDNEYPCYEGGGDPLTLGEPIGWAALQDSDDPNGKNAIRSLAIRLLDEIMAAQTHYATEWNKGTNGNSRLMSEAEGRRDNYKQKLLAVICGEEIPA